MSEVRLKCDNGHLTIVNSVKPKSISNRAERGSIVCPFCKPDNVQLTVIGSLAGKLFVCENHHVTEVYLFDNGMCNISWLNQYENIAVDAESILDQISKGIIRCRCNDCNKELVAIDSEILRPPQMFGIKTKIRVGDIWDKNNCPTPRESTVVDGKDGPQIKESEFSKRNRSRIQDMRRKTGTRLSKPRGEIIHKATNRSYRDGHSKKPSKKDLTNE